MADMTDKAIKLGAPAEVADAGQAVLRLLRARARRTRRTTSRPSGPTSTRASSTTAGTRCASGLRPPEGAGRDPGRRRADAAARGDPGLGRHAGGAEAGAAAPDGGLRRLPRVHRPPRRPAARRARGPRRPREHARLLHHRRQRRLGRGHAERHLQRDDQLQRRRRARDARVHDGAARRLRRPGLVQPLRGRLGARDVHAVPVDEAGRLALGRHPQRHDRPLAGRNRGAGRDPHPVRARDRRRPDRARGGRAAGSRRSCNGVQQTAARGRRAWPTRSTTPAPPSATRRSTSRCSATAASTTRAGPP